MNHWHQCRRWWERNLDCPFRGMEDHEDDVETGDPPDDAPTNLLLPAKEREVEDPLEIPEPLGDPLPIPALEPQLPLPFPFPIPPPAGVPQLPGFPPWIPPDPVPARAPGPLPRQAPLPSRDRPGLIPQPVAEGAGNLLGHALGLVPNSFRATSEGVLDLFGVIPNQAGAPPNQQQQRIAVAEAGAAAIVAEETSKARRFREWQRQQAEEAEATRERDTARKERARKEKDRGRRVTGRKVAAAVGTLAGAGGAAYLTNRFRKPPQFRGGFGGLQVNMAARMRALTAIAGARSQHPELRE